MAQVNEILNGLQKQYEDENDPDKKKKIRNQYLRAIDQVEAIAGKTLGENTEKYNAAVAELEKANDELKKAREGLSDFAEAVNKVARAIDTVAEVAATVV